MFGFVKKKIMKFDKYKMKGAYHWRQYENHTGYRSHVQKVLSWIRAGKTFDVGAGDGLITFLLKCSGIDDNELAVQFAKEKGANVSLGSAYNLAGFGKFDNVLLLDVLEHLEHPEKALQEVRKILEEGGQLYITTPPANEGEALDPYHVQEWTLEGLISFVEQNGFKCIDSEIIFRIGKMYTIFTL